MSKKIGFLIIIILALGVGFKAQAAIGPLLPDSLIYEAACPGNQCSLNTFLKVGINLANIILGLVGALALLMFVYGGVVWLLSGGSSEQVTKGKEIILGSVVGILIVFGSYTIIQFVINNVLVAQPGYEFTGTAPEDTKTEIKIGDKCKAAGGTCTSTCSGSGVGYANDCATGQFCCIKTGCEAKITNGKPNQCKMTCDNEYVEMPSPALPCANSSYKCCEYNPLIIINGS